MKTIREKISQEKLSKCRLRVLFNTALLFFLCLSTTGQTYYSVDPDFIKSKSAPNPLLSKYQSNYPDSSILNLANVADRNFLGNTGLASVPYFLKTNNADLGFIFFRPFLQNDRLTEDQISYFRSIGPYAQLSGITGGGQMQSFKMFFTQTFKDKLNLAVKFNRYTSTGFYKRQQTYTNNLLVTGNQVSKNKRFGYYFSFINNSNKSSENGGLRQFLTDTTVLFTKQLLAVNLSSATRDNREYILAANPYVRLNKKSDSLHTINHYLQLSTKWRDQSFQYKDKSPIADRFYKDIKLDSALTNDSTHVRQFTNDLAYTISGISNRSGATAGLKDEITQYWQIQSLLFRNQMAHAEFFIQSKIDTSKKANWHLSITTSQVLAGYNKGDSKQQAILKGTLTPSLNYFVSAQNELRKADYFLLNWQGNNFSWSNDLEKIRTQQMKVMLNYRKVLSASWLLQSVKGFVYFDRMALPTQYLSTIINQSLNVNANKVFFKHLGLSADYTYQSSSKKSIMRFPEHTVAAKIFYSGSFYKNNLQLNIGSKIQVFQNFTPYAYMPATQTFYLQDGNKTGSYPYLDFYLSGRIRPVSFFVTIQNVLREFAGKSYFLVPGYYQPERALRFGITWVFFD